jgi:hypothetical protein
LFLIIIFSQILKLFCGTSPNGNLCILLQSPNQNICTHTRHLTNIEPWEEDEQRGHQCRRPATRGEGRGETRCNDTKTQWQRDERDDKRQDAVQRHGVAMQWDGMRDNKGQRDIATTNQRNKWTDEQTNKAGGTWGDDVARGEDVTQG